MDKYYRIILENMVGYTKSYNNAISLQNYLYEKTQKVSKIKPLEKSQIPIKDWELINKLTTTIKIAVRIK